MRVAVGRLRRAIVSRGLQHRQVLRAASDIPLDELHVADSLRAEFVWAVAVEFVRD